MNTNNLRFVEREEKTCTKEEILVRKKKLRAYMKERRGENENRDMKATCLADNLFQVLDGFDFKDEEKTAFVYLGFSSEAPTDGLIEKLIERGWKILCPKTEEREMFAVEYGEDFTLNALGIREPIGTPSEEEMDVVLLPLLAVDVDGNRLGYGGGYYDKYLRTHGEAVRVGYGYDFQVMGRVPHTDKDEKVDFIVTEKRILSPQRKG